MRWLSKISVVFLFFIALLRYNIYVLCHHIKFERPCEVKLDCVYSLFQLVCNFSPCKTFQNEFVQIFLSGVTWHSILCMRHEHGEPDLMAKFVISMLVHSPWHCCFTVNAKNYKMTVFLPQFPTEMKLTSHYINMHTFNRSLRNDSDAQHLAVFATLCWCARLILDLAKLHMKRLKVWLDTLIPCWKWKFGTDPAQHLLPAFQGIFYFALTGKWLGLELKYIVVVENNEYGLVYRLHHTQLELKL